MFLAGSSNLSSGLFEYKNQSSSNGNIDNNDNLQLVESERFTKNDYQPRIGSVRGSGPFNPKPSGPLYDVK